ncbi:hypothetical protein BJ322DRAFT_1063262 [Thelephora terrestris]|uniref:SnoaL-like domain-containing protein n=1 Tax=Thelephora terrestris TaxID=56493 RepID=A0A9P6HF54_9AGAM|nr:hypothetical protein BJ322DRAFT_1063262 [Thelephora terrestris]
MSSQQTTDSPQIKLTYEWAEGFRKKDLGVIAKLLHEDHRRITYPQSLGIPEQTKEEYIQQMTEIINVWTDGCELTLHSIIETPGTLVVHFTNKANTSLGVEMVRESIMIGQIVTDEDGSLKIKRIEEFTDSKSYLDLLKALGEARAKVNK